MIKNVRRSLFGDTYLVTIVVYMVAILFSIQNAYLYMSTNYIWGVEEVLSTNKITVGMVLVAAIIDAIIKKIVKSRK